VDRVSADAQTYDVDLTWLRRGLEEASSAGVAWPHQRQRLADRLSVIAREARAADDATRRAGAARASLASVLAQRSFAPVRGTSWQRTLRQRIRDWLADLAVRAVGRAIGARQVGMVLAWSASMAAIAVLLVWLARIVARQRMERPIGVGPVGHVATPGHVLGMQAAELIRAGHIRDGARLAYRAALHRLAEEGALDLDAARTPRENLRRLAPSHRRAAPLTAMTAAFERIWYGSRQTDEGEGVRLLRLLGDMECLPSDRRH
jgi:hypothetical protein